MKELKNLFFYLLIGVSGLLPLLVNAEGSRELYITTYATELYCCNDFVDKCNYAPQYNGTDFSNTLWSFSNFTTFFLSITSNGPIMAWVQGMNSYYPSVSYYPQADPTHFRSGASKIDRSFHRTSLFTFS
jgi:hypothetical protein